MWTLGTCLITKAPLTWREKGGYVTVEVLLDVQVQLMIRPTICVFVKI